MKATGVLCSLLLATGTLAAEPPNWAQMQSAVLREHDLDRIRSLVAAGVDPNAPIGCGTFAPLDGAISQGSLEMVTLLLSLGAKPTDTQMVRAVAAPTPDALAMVKLLLAAGASINARDYYSKPEDRYSNPIHQAVSRGSGEMVAYLLSQQGIELNNPDVVGYTPLMGAVAKGDAQIVDMLLAAGADPRWKNKAGLDAAAVAERVIKQQQSFLAKLARTPEPTRANAMSVPGGRPLLEPAGGRVTP